jgi:hypothetical protein
MSLFAGIVDKIRLLLTTLIGKPQVVILSLLYRERE